MDLLHKFWRKCKCQKVDRGVSTVAQGGNLDFKCNEVVVLEYIL